MDQMLKALEAALAAILSGAVMLLAKQLAAKFKIDIAAGEEASLRSTVQSAILATEEKAASAAKLDQVALSSTQKLDHAVGLIVEKVPGVSADEATQLVHE